VNLGSARGLTRGLTEEVVARTVSRGELVHLTVGAELVNAAIHDVVASTVRMVQDSLADAPPDLSQDVSARGLTLVGGMSRLSDLAELIAQNTGVEIRVADEPDLVVVRGLQLCLEEMSSLHPLFREADL
jgi:rod shape-determining protein MreB